MVVVVVMPLENAMEEESPSPPLLKGVGLRTDGNGPFGGFFVFFFMLPCFHFISISSPFLPPFSPDIELRTANHS